MSDGGFNPDNQIKKHRNSESFGVVKDSITKQFVSYPSIPISNVSCSIRTVGENKTIFSSEQYFASNNQLVKKRNELKSKNGHTLPFSCQMVLKCIFHLKKRPFDRSHIIDILSGRKTYKIKKYYHERLYVNGKLKGYTRENLNKLIDKLIQDKYLFERNGAMSKIMITQKGINYLESFGTYK